MLTISVISPEATLFEGQASSLTAPAFDGEAYLGDGPAINSDFLDGLHIDHAKQKIIEVKEGK